MDINYINENVQLFEEAATTMDAVSYLPSQVGMVKAKLLQLKKMKNKWDLEILESAEEISVLVEDALRIDVPLEHWDSFQEMFNVPIDENSYLNLQSELFEEELTESSLYISRVKELQEKLDKLLTCSLAESIRTVVSGFLKNFQEVERNEFVLSETVKKELKENQNDVGFVETLIEDMHSLAENTLMKGRYKFQNPNMILEVRISQDKDCSVSLMFEDGEIADRLEEAVVGLHRIGKVVYPRIGQILSENNIIENIKEVLGDMEDEVK